MPTKDELIAAIKTVRDPEINLDIWTMGLVYEIDIQSESAIRLVMTYTTPFCPFGPELTEQVRDKLKNLGFSTIDLEVTFDPPWKPPAELRAMLGI